MDTTDVRSAFREMWETRPARPRDDRQIAGVAAAVARRYDIDPTLVRVGFVVAAFFGIGAALYIAGWIALPDTPADPSAPQSRPRGILVVGLVIAIIAMLGSVFGGHGGFVIPLIVAAALLFLLHRSRSDRGIPGAGRPPRPSGGGQAQSWPPAAASTTQAGTATEGVSLVKGVAARKTVRPPRAHRGRASRPSTRRSRRRGTRSAPPRSPGTSPSPGPRPRPSPRGGAGLR